MRIDEIIDEIKSRLDIVDVISEYLHLKKTGANFKGLCPFHDEKTPSFTVSPSKQFYYCFGCGESGDVISFLKKIENVSFNEALRILSERAGVKFDPKHFDGKDEESEFRSRLLAVLSSAKEIYAETLRESTRAMNYLLNERSLSMEIIERFSIGYAPDTKDYLLKRLLQRGYDERLIRDAGLTIGFQGGSYDLLRNRIVFPIFNPRGETIGFGGRLMPLPEDSVNELPKYINSPETPLFKKGENLFGYHQAKDAIKKEGFAIITEGYMDVIMCHQHGFSNVVAPLGTALTPRQLRILKKLTERIILLFDGDTAGINATRRAIQIFIEENLRPEILFLPHGEDPDSFIRRYGPDEFKRLFERTENLIDFYLSKTSPSLLTETVKEIISIISKVEDGIIRAEYIRRLSERTGIRESIIFDEILKSSKKTLKKKKIPLGMDESTLLLKNKRLREEELLMAVIIHHPDKTEFILREIEDNDVEDPILKRIFFELREFTKHGRENEITSLLDLLPSEGKKTIATLILDVMIDNEDIDKLIMDCLKGIKLRRLNRRVEEAKKNGDLLTLQELIRERKELLNTSLKMVMK